MGYIRKVFNGDLFIYFPKTSVATLNLRQVKPYVSYVKIS